MSEVQVAGWVLLHFVWQGALVGLATAVVLRGLRSTSAATHYIVACTGLAMMIASPIVTARLLSTTAVASQPISKLPFAQVNSTALHAETLLTSSVPAQNGVSLQTVRLALNALLPALVGAWFAGVALLLLRLAGGWWRVRRLHLDALALASSQWQAVSDRIASRLHLGRRVLVVDSLRVDTPTALGWLQPVVLLPIAALANLAPAQVEAILAHELAHIRRHDYLVNLLQTLAETLLFYHPAVWWVSSQIRTERENCCDDVAVSVCGDAIEYAAALTELETWRTLRTGTAALTLAATDGSLLARVRRVLLASDAGRSSAATVTVTLVLLSVMLVGGWPRLSTVTAFSRAQERMQPAAKPLAFEVVSIKPAPPGSGGGRYLPMNGRLTGTLSLHNLIAMAYRSVDPALRFDQIVGEPNWASSVFSINATVGPDGPTERTAFSKALFPMIKTLMEDRFKLAAHIEKRERQVYALVVARSDGRLGPQIRRVTDDECAARRLKMTNGTLTPSDPRPCGGLLPTPTGFKMFGASMTMIASQLQDRGAGRPILDRTNVAGNFDIDFQWAPEANRLSTDANAAAPSDPTSFFMAVQEQLGLKFESRREPLDVLIVDHVERPTED